MKTPDYNHIFTNKKFQNVYEPSEDTFVLLDALEQDLDRIRKHCHKLDSINLLEIGTGNGVPIIFLYQLAKSISKNDQKIKITATDVNPIAIECAKETFARNRIETQDFQLINTDLFKNLDEKFSFILFNPPYVVSSNSEFQESQENKDLFAALSGGLDGRKLIDRFLDQVLDFLIVNGCCYLVLIDKNKPDEIISFLESQKKMQLESAEIIFTRRAGIELLHVLRICRK